MFRLTKLHNEAAESDIS